MGEEEIWIIGAPAQRNNIKVPQDATMAYAVIEAVDNSLTVTKDPKLGSVCIGYLPNAHFWGTVKTKLFGISYAAFFACSRGLEKMILDNSKVAGIIYVNNQCSDMNNFKNLLGDIGSEEPFLPKRPPKSLSFLVSFRESLKSSPWYKNGCPIVHLQPSPDESNRNAEAYELLHDRGFTRHYSEIVDWEDEFDRFQKCLDVSDFLEISVKSMISNRDVGI
jgi:hypothetical protein